MSTDISICSEALSIVGADTIGSFDEATIEAEACRTHYEPTKKKMLAKHRWRFCKAQVSLNMKAQPPLFGYANAFQLPPDFKQMVSLDGGATFEIVGDELQTDAAIAQITYIRTVNESTMPAYFQAALVLELAKIFSTAVMDSISKAQVFAEQARVEMIHAKQVDSQQDTSHDMNPSNYLLTQVRG